VERGVAGASERMMRLLPPQRVEVLTGQVTMDLDTTDVECCGRLKRGMAYNYQGQRVGRPHVAVWAETTTVLAADLLSGDEDPRPGAPALLRRALAGLPKRVRAGKTKVRMRADAGYFAGELARAAHEQGIEFAVGGKRIATLWRTLAGLTDDDWTDAIEMTGAQVAVANYRPDWWPEDTYLLIRRVRLDIEAGQVSSDLRSRRRRTLHPDQQKLPLPDLAKQPAVYAYSFILTLCRVGGYAGSVLAAALSRISSVTANTAPRCVTCPRATSRSTPPGCGARCWPPPWPAGSTRPPGPSWPTTPSPDTASDAAKP
jgi:hypothetical protein